jgi:hypothetical protein
VRMSHATRALLLFGVTLSVAACSGPATTNARLTTPTTTNAPEPTFDGLPSKPTFGVLRSSGQPGTKIIVAGSGCAVEGVRSIVVVGLTTPDRETTFAQTQVETVQRRPWDVALVVPPRARPGGAYRVNAICFRNNLTAFDYPSTRFTVTEPPRPTHLPGTS